MHDPTAVGRERRERERAERAEAECVRLRGRLNAAREGLLVAVEGFSDRYHKAYFDAVTTALRRSDPDAAPATEF